MAFKLHKKISTAAFVNVLAVALLGASPAMAGSCKTSGFVAKAFCKVGILSETKAKEWDKWHKQQGKPLEKLLQKFVGKQIEGQLTK